jgi:UDP-N-acetylmuramoyl-tripeptide--D-alanyl-D-alanine ligase
MINNFLIFVLFFCYFLVQIKNLLFYLYLWQLKEYHLKRFLAHFSTYNGKKIIFNLTNLLKIFLLCFLLFSQKINLNFYLILSFYFILLGNFLISLFKKNIVKPKFTLKIIFLFLFFTSLILAFSKFLFFKEINKYFFLNLLLFDILIPFLISFFILFFQFFVSLYIKLLILKAKKKREEFKNLLVIGITGSYGKTSTKELLFTVLSSKFGEKVIKTREHINAEVGIAKTILENLNQNHKIFIAEIGAYERGKIKEVSEMIKPKIGILTGICQQHLATFGSLENIQKGKFELIESLEAQGIAILNWDNDFIKERFERIKDKLRVKKIIFCSTKEERADVFAKDFFVSKNSILFKVKTKDNQEADFKLNLIGIDYAINALLVAACALELGMNLNEISLALSKIKDKDTGCYLEKYNENTQIIFATYSANPFGVMAHLNHLKLWQGKKIVIMPCLIELGKEAKEIHQKIGKEIAKNCDLGIIITKDYYQEVKSGAKTFGKEDKIIFSSRSEEILKTVLSEIEKDKDNIILLEGRMPEKIISLFKKNV